MTAPSPSGTHVPPPPPELAELRAATRRKRWLLFGSFATVLALIWVAFVEHAVYEHRAALRAVRDRDSNLAAAVQHYVVRILRNAEAMNGLVAEAYGQDPSDAAMLPVLAGRARANDAFTELGLCLPEGRVLSTASTQQASLDRVMCRGLAAASHPGRVGIAGPFPSRRGTQQVALVTRLRADSPEGLAVALASGRMLLALMESLELRDETEVTLVTSDGKVLSAWESGRTHGTRGVRPAAFSVHAADRGPWLVTVRPVLPWDLTVRVATLEKDALADFRTRRVNYLALGVLATAALAGALLVLLRLQGRSYALGRSLAHAHRRLEELNASLEAQVHERTTQSRRAYDQLETFTHAIAHDVRGPLAAIRTFAQMIEPVVAVHGTDKQRHYARRVVQGAEQLDDMVGHLLRLGRLTAIDQREAVDLAPVARAVLERLHELEPGRDVRWSVPAHLPVEGDRTLLRQLLENVLGNAWKFTAQRSPARIEVGCEPAEPGWVRVFVRDNGAGFDPSQAHGLFEPFRRMHGRDEFPGTGIGLAFVRRIVELHGGSIGCEAAPDEGARFHFTLPAAPTLQE